MRGAQLLAALLIAVAAATGAEAARALQGGCKDAYCTSCPGNPNVCVQCASETALGSSVVIAGTFAGIDGKCHLCQEKTVHCLSCDGRTGSCTACNDGYGVSNGGCEPCAPTCAVCSKNATKCEYCAVGGVDATTGQCVRCKQAGCTAVGCKRDASKCTACRAGWRLQGTKCIKK